MCGAIIKSSSRINPSSAIALIFVYPGTNVSCYPTGEFPCPICKPRLRAGLFPGEQLGGRFAAAAEPRRALPAPPAAHDAVPSCRKGFSSLLGTCLASPPSPTPQPSQGMEGAAGCTADPLGTDGMGAFNTPASNDLE